MARSEIVNAIMTAPHRCGSDGMWERGDAVEVASGLAMAIDVTCGAGPIHHLERFWIYNEARGLWETIGHGVLRGIAAGWAGEPIYAEDKDGNVKPKSLKINNTKPYVDELESLCAREGHQDSFNDAPTGVAFTNGFVAIDGYEAKLYAHDPENLARAGYDFEYWIVHEPAPRFKSYLYSLWDDDDVEARVDMIQEWLGMAILGMSTKFHRALILKGRKGSGKSTFINILKGLLPSGDATGDETSVAPEQFGEDPYLYKLAFAKLNAVYEGEDRPIMDQARLRAVVSGEPMSINVKYRATPLTARITCAHIFAYNDLPQVPGAHAAFWDRFLVLDLDKTVRGTELEIDDLAEHILREERAYIVGWCIQGALRALRQGGYTIPKSVQQQLALWSGDADSVAAWMEAEAKVSSDFYTSLAALYKSYRDWAIAAGMQPVNQRTFGRRLRHLPGVLERREPGVGKVQLSITLV